MNDHLRNSLEKEDPEIFRLIEAEKYRQYSNLELIASEVKRKKNHFQENEQL
jgi:glycine hydroxymethyltransferase